MAAPMIGVKIRLSIVTSNRSPATKPTMPTFVPKKMTLPKIGVRSRMCAGVAA